MDHPQSGIFLDAAAFITVGTALSYVTARAVFAPGRATYLRSNGAALLHLTIGLIFVGLYGLLDLLAPHAFSGLNLEEGERRASSTANRKANG
jgi:hypothetical protein